MTLGQFLCWLRTSHHAIKHYEAHRLSLVCLNCDRALGPGWVVRYPVASRTPTLAQWKARHEAGRNREVA